MSATSGTRLFASLFVTLLSKKACFYFTNIKRYLETRASSVNKNKTFWKSEKSQRNLWIMKILAEKGSVFTKKVLRFDVNCVWIDVTKYFPPWETRRAALFDDLDQESLELEEKMSETDFDGAEREGGFKDGLLQKSRGRRLLLGLSRSQSRPRLPASNKVAPMIKLGHALKNARSYLQSLPFKPKISWNWFYPNVHSQALDVLGENANF